MSSSEEPEPVKPVKKASKKAKQDDERKKESRKDKGKEKRGREKEKVPKEKKQKRSSPKREGSKDSHGRSKTPKKQKPSSPEREVSKGSGGKKSKATKDKNNKAGPPRKALSKAEAKLEKINSNTHHTEWLRYKRWIENKKRFPAALGDRITDEDGRKRLFVDYVQSGGDPEEILLRHEQQLQESQRSRIRYGFRGEKWITDTHGDVKGQKIMERKRMQGLKPDYIMEREESERERESVYVCVCVCA